MTRAKERLLVIAVMVALVAALAWGLRPSALRAQAAVCDITGNLMSIAGSAAANARVYFRGTSLPQSYGGSVIMPGSFSVLTDSSGNLPTSPPVTIPQGAYVLVTIGTGQPVRIQIPLATTADLSTLILANSDPPSVVSGIAINNCSTCSVTNPPTGGIGTATLNLGGSQLPSATASGQYLIVTAAGTSWAQTALSGDATSSTTTPGFLTVTSLRNVSSPISVLGQGNGTDAVANVNLNGEWDVGTFGASGSLATTTGTVGASSASLTVGSATGWQAGMYANISGAGAATSLGLNSTAPTATCGGTSCAGSDTFSYQCVAGDVFGGYTATSPSGSSTVVGVTSLSTTTYVTVTCATVTGATWYGVYRTTVPSGSSQAVGLIGFYSHPNGSASDWVDNGTVAITKSQVDDLPTVAPVSAHADRLISEVTAISGTTMTISPAAITGVTSVTVRHDDTTPIQKALDACNNAGGGIVRLAAGGLSPVTNSGSPYLSTASFKNLALLFYSNCAIEGSGWNSGLQAESVQDTLYPKNGVQYTGVGTTSTTNVTMRDFQIDGNNTAVPFADGYVGSGGAETVQVGIYPDGVNNAAYTDLYVHNTGEDAFYAGNGGYSVIVSASRFSAAGFYDHLGQYRGFEQGCGSHNWKLVGSTIDGNSGEGIDINTECGGTDDSGWAVVGNDIWGNQSYAFTIGDAGESVAGTGTRRGLVEGNNIHDNTGAFYLVAAGSGHAADLSSIKITGNTISDDLNYAQVSSGTGVYFNCGSGAGTCEDIDFTDNDFTNSTLPSGSPTALVITNTSVSRTLINGNRFKNWTMGSSVPIDDAGTDTIIGCNVYNQGDVYECGTWDQGLYTAASGGAMELGSGVLVGNLNFNGHSATAFSNICAGTIALTSGTPSTATVTNACVTTGCRPSCTDETSVSAIRCVPSAGSLALTGPASVTDTVAWSCQ